MQRLNVIFAGTPEFAAQHLQVLLDNSPHHVIAVYTQPDRPSGRGKKLTASPVKSLALDKSIPVYQPPSLKDDAAQQQLAALNADIMVVVAYGLILPPAVLAIPRLGCINVHASLLPRWRGAAPIQRAIEAGDSQSGITIMQMDEGLDTGPMLSRTPCSISATDTSSSLQDKLALSGGPALLVALDSYANSDQTPETERQQDDLATYAHKITKPEARIDWAQTAAAIARQVRAFHPIPVAFTTIGKDTLRIWKACAIEHVASPTPNRSDPETSEPGTRPSEAEAGTIVACDENGILVACGKETLLLTEVQLSGKKRTAVADLLRGRATLFAPGTRLGD